MKRWAIRLTLLLALLVLGLWAWRTCFPNPERVIRARLAELTQLASYGANEAPAAKLWNAQRLASVFTPDVIIKVDFPGEPTTFSGRDAIATAAMLARERVSTLVVQFSDIVITLAPDKRSAIAELSAKGRAGGETDTFGPQELSLRMKKDGSRWFISRVETVKTLR